MIDGVVTKYENLMVEVSSFLGSHPLPRGHSELKIFLDVLDALHWKVVSLRSEIGFLQAEISKELSDVYRRLFVEEGRFRDLQRWEVDIVIGKSPEVNDIQMVLQKLETVKNALDSCIWLLKDRRGSAVQFMSYMI